MHRFVVRAVACVAAVSLGGCQDEPLAPRAGEYELIAVNGQPLPVILPVADGVSYRLISERLTFDTRTTVRARQVGQWIGQEPREPFETAMEYVVVTESDSSRFVFPCPMNARCSVPPRSGPVAFGDTLDIREFRVPTVQLRFVRRR